METSTLTGELSTAFMVFEIWSYPSPMFQCFLDRTHYSQLLLTASLVEVRLSCPRHEYRLSGNEETTVEVAKYVENVPLMRIRVDGPCRPCRPSQPSLFGVASGMHQVARVFNSTLYSLLKFNADNSNNTFAVVCCKPPWTRMSFDPTLLYRIVSLYTLQLILQFLELDRDYAPLPTRRIQEFST